MPCCSFRFITLAVQLTSESVIFTMHTNRHAVKLDDGKLAFAFILAMNGKYWNRLSESKTQGRRISFFVRKNAVGPIQTERLLFYVEKPRMQVLGAADFVERILGEAEDLGAVMVKRASSTRRMNTAPSLRAAGK